MRNFKKLYCYNCYRTKHTAKFCKYPVLSFGIICYHVCEGGEIKYLMVQRKYSYAFVDFIFGKYDILDYSYLSHLFERMTSRERLIIRNTVNFRSLWGLIFGSNINTSKGGKQAKQAPHEASTKYAHAPEAPAKRPRSVLRTSDFGLRTSPERHCVDSGCVRLIDFLQ